jgi:curved DNA-binding protein CbpA
VTAARDPWSVLGVPEGADAEAIRRAFRTLAHEHHPDRSSAPGAEERFRELVAAYEQLGGPGRRRGRGPRGDASAIHAFYAWLASRQPQPAAEDEAAPAPPAPPRRDTAIRLAALAALLYAVALAVLLLTR